MWTIIHALTDGLSGTLIIQAVKQAYLFHRIAGPEPFKSFSGLTSAEQASKEKSYWVEQLRGAQHVAAFPTPPSIDFRPRTDSRFKKEIQLSSGLQKTPYRLPLILRAAWALTVSSVSRSSDIVFGMALNGRNNSSGEDVIGPMITIVPVRVRVDTSVTLAAFLDELYAQSVSMMEFEHTGLHVISNYGPEFRTACWFQSLFVIQASMGEDSYAYKGSNLNDSNLDWLDGSEAEHDTSEAFMVECLPGPTDVEIRTSFDSRAINQQAVQHVVSIFATIVGSLQRDCQNIDMKVRDILDTANESVPPEHVDGSEPSRDVNFAVRSRQTQGQDVKVDEVRIDSIEEGLGLEGLSAHKTAEDALIEFWGQVLRDQTAFGPEDHFIVRGGDSIKAIRLVAVARRAGYTITVANILRHPVLRDMASYIKSNEVKVPSSPNEQPLGGVTSEHHLKSAVARKLKLAESDIERILPTTPFQKHTMDLCLKTPGVAVFQQIYTIHPEMEDVDRLSRAWELVCEAFSNLRTRVMVPSGRTDLVQIILRGRHEKLEVKHFQTRNESMEYLGRVRLDASALESPMARAAVLHVEGNPSSFVWSVNHVVYDGFTMAIIWKALNEAYWERAVMTRLLPAESLLTYISSRKQAAALRYWREYTTGAVPITFPAPPSDDTGHKNRVATVSRSVISVVDPSGLPFTMATVIRATWGLTIASYTRTSCVTYLGLLSGRTAPVDGIETMMGPTVSYVPIRIPIHAHASDSTLDFVTRIHGDAVDAMPHETVGIQAIAHMDDEMSRLIASINNLVIINNGRPQEPQPPLPLTPSGGIMDFTGFLALFIYCTIEESSIEVLMHFDDVVLNQPQVDEIAERFAYFIQSLVTDVQSGQKLPLGRLSAKFHEATT